MDLSTTIDIDFQVCHCRSISCDCDDETRTVTVSGFAWDSSEGWATELDEVSGLPEGWALSDLEDHQRAQLTHALVEAADRIESKRRKLPAELQRIADGLRRALKPVALDPSLSPEEKVGAMRFACRRAVEELETLNAGVRS